MRVRDNLRAFGRSHLRWVNETHRPLHLGREVSFLPLDSAAVDDDREGQQRRQHDQHHESNQDGVAGRDGSVADLGQKAPGQMCLQMWLVTDVVTESTWAESRAEF